MALRDLGVVEDGSVLIRDGVIVAIGSSRRIENLNEAKQALEIPVHGKVVMPAFVDAGLNVSANRGSGAASRKSTSEFHDETLGLLRACLQYGTLWAEVKTHAYDGDYESVIPALRQVTKIGQNPLSIARTWRLDTAPSPDEDVMARAQHTLAYLVRRKLIDFVEVPAAECCSETCLNFLRAVRAAGVGTKAEWSGRSMTSLEPFLSEALPRSLQLAMQVDTKAHDMLARSRSVLVFSPGQEFVDSAKGNSAMRALIDAGAAVALSSGYDLRHPTSVSMQMALALAVIRLQLTPEEAISAGTINAAHALGIGNSTGTLEAGKQADLIVLTIGDYRELARQFGINHVGMVMRQGNLVFNRTRWRPGVS
jgi:imidazolonepropionase